MSVGNADLAKAIATGWSAWGIDNVFKSYWSVSVQSSFTSLNEGEASPGQPFPYCVFNLSEGEVATRMTGEAWNEQQQIRDQLCSFHVFAKPITAMSAKESAAMFAELIIGLFGGHPTQQPQELELDHGAVLLQQYQRDYPIRVGDAEYEWVIDYLFRLDVPVRLKG